MSADRVDHSGRPFTALMRNGVPWPRSTGSVPFRSPLDHSSSRYQDTSWAVVRAVISMTSGS
ncbi:hypothetical protein, partial [Streptomyces sp. H39-C1]|uniref:hypothetical protein n=1 Tax=Streptomyces sp. H39-C1 TaxID=3004355 RepID=UPI002F359801